MECKMRVDGDLYQAFIEIAKSFTVMPISVIEEAHKQGCKAMHYYTTAIDGSDSFRDYTFQPQTTASWKTYINSEDVRLTARGFMNIFDLLSKVWVNGEVERTLTISPCEDGKLQITLNEQEA